MHKPYISVIIPLYNKEPIIEHTVRSVLSQSFTNFEVVIVNDGSTDGSMDIVRSISDPRIVIIEQENGGPSKARNTGVKYSTGNWIVFLDADDELLPDALNTFYHMATQHPSVDIFDYGRLIQSGNQKVAKFNSERGVINNNFKSWFYGEISPGAGASVFKREFVLKYPYNEEIRRYEDAELLFRILKEAIVYSSGKIVELHNNNYAEASKVRQDIIQDFVGHLNFCCSGFWELMCMYNMYIMERLNYPEAMKKLYPQLYWRYDLLILYKLMKRFRI